MQKIKQNPIHKYFVEFGTSMTAYIIVLLSVVANRPDEGFLGLAKAFDLLPIIPLLLAFWAIIRQYKRMDEFNQRIQSEAFALGALTWGLILMAWGFAENAGMPKLPTIFVAPGLIALWGLSLPIISRRYK